MTVTEKTAYLRGLMDGLKINKDTDEGRLFEAIVDTLESLALAVSDIEENNDVINDELDMIEDALDSIDEELELIDEDLGVLFDEDWDEDDFDDDEEYYELICPTCGEELILDGDLLAEGEMKCPACGEDLEFDLSELKDEEDE